VVGLGAVCRCRRGRRCTQRPALGGSSGDGDAWSQQRGPHGGDGPVSSVSAQIRPLQGAPGRYRAQKKPPWRPVWWPAGRSEDHLV